MIPNALVDHLLSQYWSVDLSDGYRQKLFAKATTQHEIEYWCSAGKAKVIGYRRDVRAIQEREQRMANEKVRLFGSAVRHGGR